jgi:hypothetical protein
MLLLRFIALQEFGEQYGPEHTTVEAQDGFNQLRQLVPREPSEFVSLANVVDALGQKTFNAAVSHRACIDALEQIRVRASAFPQGDLTLAVQLHADKDASKAQIKEAAETEAGNLKRELEKELAALQLDLTHAEKTVNDLNGDLTSIQLGEVPSGHKSAQPEPIASRKDYVQESPAIRSLLKPFTTPRYAQPESADKMIHGSAKKVRINYFPIVWDE